MRSDAFTKLILAAEKAEFESRAHSQWCALLPLMQMKMIDYEPFSAYIDRLTGKDMDLRPKDDILAEVEEIRKELEG